MTTPNQIVDHTLLAPTATPDEIEALCRHARDNRFYSVCVSPTYVARATSLVEGSDVHVCTVVGFPSGAHTSAVKAYETRTAVEDGADEIDMVMNLASAKAHDWAAVENDIRASVSMKWPHMCPTDVHSIRARSSSLSVSGWRAMSACALLVLNTVMRHAFWAARTALASGVRSLSSLSLRLE